MWRALWFVALVIGLAGAAWAGTPFHDPVFGSLQTSNLVYGTGGIDGGAGSFDLTLDLFQPTNIGVPTPSISPGIVMIHGGSFTGGDKSELDPLAAAFATYGYTTVSINYRLQGQNLPAEPGPFPSADPLGNAINAAIADATKAMGWMRDNAATYHIDPAHIAIGGYSAGAITAEYVAYSNPPGQLAPQAVVAVSGGMYNGHESLIQPGAPPALIYHGDADTTVPIELALAVKSQLDAVGVYNEFYTGIGLGHLPFLPAPYPPGATIFSLPFGDQTLVEHNIEFLARFLVPEPSGLVLAGIVFLGLPIIWKRRQTTTKHSRHLP